MEEMEPPIPSGETQLQDGKWIRLENGGILGRANSVDLGDRSRAWHRDVFLEGWRLERTCSLFRIYEISTKETGGTFERECFGGDPI